MKKYFRSDHPIIKDMVYPKQGIGEPLRKYFTEDNFLINSKIYKENKEISDFYNQGLKKFSWKIPDDIQSSLDEE